MKSYEYISNLLIILAISISLSSSYGNGPTLSFQSQSKTKSSHQTFLIPQLESSASTKTPNDLEPEVEIHETVTLLNQSKNTLVVSPLGNGVILCLLKKLNLISPSTLYISRDNGKTFKDETQLLINNTDTEENANPTISRVFSSPQKENTGQLVLIDDQNELIFTTNDYASSFNGSKIPFVPDKIIFDPTGGKILIAYEIETNTILTGGTGNKKLWMSADFGFTWKMVQEFVKSVSWDTATMQLYIHKKEPGQRALVITSESPLFEDPEDISVILEDVDEFIIKENHMFATKKSQTNLVQLWISFQSSRFVRALFPSYLRITNFHIAHISSLDERIFVCVTNEHGLSDLYVSSPLLNIFISQRFTLSLEKIILLSSSSKWEEGVTLADFSPVQPDHIPGVFLANVLNTHPASYASAKRNNQNVLSMVTFDNGDEWRPVNCSFAPHNCSLQLGNQLSPVSIPGPGPVKSQNPTVASSVMWDKTSGILLAAGQINDYPGSLLISKDGAQTWTKSLEGNYLFQVGAAGGLILGVKQFKNQIADTTDSFHYSTDKGENWATFKFYNESIGVIGFMSMSTDDLEKAQNSTTELLIIGSTIRTEKSTAKKEANSNKNNWVLIHVDLKSNKKSKFPRFDEIREFMLVSMANQIRRIDLNNLKVDTVVKSKSESEKVTGMEFDMTRNVIYWVDEDQNETRINRQSLDVDVDSGGDQESQVITSSNLNDSLISSLALDWLSQNLYVCDREKTLIQVVGVGQGNKGWFKTILKSPEVTYPRDIAVHPGRGYLFWTDFSYEDENPFIGRSWLDGSNVQKIIESPIRIPISNNRDRLNNISTTAVTGTGTGTQAGLSTFSSTRQFHSNLKNPISLTIDFEQDRIYWIDVELSQITSLDLDGRNIRILLKGNKRLEGSITLGIHKKWMYWYKWLTNEMYALKKAMPTSAGGGNSENEILRIKTNQIGVLNLKVYSSGSQSLVGGRRNVCCGNENATCSHFCFNFPANIGHENGNNNNTHLCECPDDMIISTEDATRCELKSR